MNTQFLTEIKHYFLNLQTQLCQTLTTLDGTQTFQEDNWQHNQIIDGRTRIMAQGTVFEKAGVNFSHVQGTQLPPSATKRHPELANHPFEAIGISLVIHPKNPYVPTTHANLRAFYANPPQADKSIWWFGGGYDLTPYYPFEEDCLHWHQTAANACAPFGKAVYKTYKQWCDEYFYLKHRKETRGVGGLFFDDLNHWPVEKCFEFVQSIGDSFMPAYIPIVQKRKDIAYGKREQTFQYQRRGRYAEFNLLYDRGTLFGLQSNGRTESILMSLPPQVEWHYNYQPEPNSPEARLTSDFLKPRVWLPEIELSRE